jgi:hypothetical protein
LEALKTAKPFTESSCNRAMNAISPLLHTLCLLLDRSCSGLWDGLQFGKRGMDFFQKLQLITEGIISCGQRGVTQAHIAEACSVLVPIAGRTWCYC